MLNTRRAHKSRRIKLRKKYKSEQRMERELNINRKIDQFKIYLVEIFMGLAAVKLQCVCLPPTHFSSCKFQIRYQQRIISFSETERSH